MAAKWPAVRSAFPKHESPAESGQGGGSCTRCGKPLHRDGLCVSRFCLAEQRLGRFWRYWFSTGGGQAKKKAIVTAPTMSNQGSRGSHDYLLTGPARRVVKWIVGGAAVSAVVGGRWARGGTSRTRRCSWRRTRRNSSREWCCRWMAGSLRGSGKSSLYATTALAWRPLRCERL